MPVKWISGLAVAAAAAAFAAPALADLVIDQEQQAADVVLPVGGPGRQVPGQVVTSGVAGFLSEIDLAVACELGAPLTVAVRDVVGGSPGPTVLATQTVDGLPPEPAWRPVELGHPPFIPSGAQFAIVLSSSSCWVWAGRLGGDPYPRGDGRYQGPPNPPDVWSPAGHDLAFKTFVEAACVVPDVGGQTESDARSMLERYGCAQLRIDRAYSASIPTGTVVAQQPTAGTQLAASGAVSVVISRGPAVCTVPKLVGSTIARARAALRAAHCRLGALRTSPVAAAQAGRVLRQKPAAGAVRADGTQVSVVVGRRR